MVRRSGLKVRQQICEPIAQSVMAKSPRAGYSKTRLCPPLRPEQAARLSAAFLRDTTETLRAAAACVPIAGYAAYAPAGTREALIPHLAPGTPLILADGSVPAPAGVEGFGRPARHLDKLLSANPRAAWTPSAPRVRCAPTPGDAAGTLR
jgi:uncharacterized protein